MSEFEAKPATAALTRRGMVASAGAALISSVLPARAQTGNAAAFEALIKAAQKEGQLVIDGPPIDAAREAISNGFKARYGINVSYISSGSSRSGARVRAERAAGKYLLDIFLSGADTPLLTFLPGGWLDPIESAIIDPEVTDLSKWQGGKLWYVDPGKRVVRLLRYVTPTLAINTKVLPSGELKNWKDVIDPKWRGKLIAKDPGVTGSGASLTAYFYLTFGPEFVKALYIDQKPVISRDARQAAQSLANGNAPMWVGPDQTEVIRFQELGYPLEFVQPADAPGIISGGWGFLTLMNRAPNPNAAKLFVNWLMSREGQTAFGKTVNSLTLRNDVDESWAPGFSRPTTDKAYVDTYDYKFVLEQRDAAFEKAKNLLGL
jgi:iron(III) transport system substrate-binding protein